MGYEILGLIMLGIVQVVGQLTSQRASRKRHDTLAKRLDKQDEVVRDAAVAAATEVIKAIPQPKKRMRRGPVAQ